MLSMHLNASHIEHGIASNCDKCPVALCLNDYLTDYIAYSENGYTFLLPRHFDMKCLHRFIEYQDDDSVLSTDIDDFVLGQDGHVLYHEDRIVKWILEFDEHKGAHSKTCHLFVEPDKLDYIYMNRTGERGDCGRPALHRKKG